MWIIRMIIPITVNTGQKHDSVATVPVYETLSG